MDAEDRGCLARLALDCVTREYPNKIAHVLHSDADVRAAARVDSRVLWLLDWHSAVHGHWMLARLARSIPGGGVCPRGARGARAQSHAPKHFG